MPLRFLRYITEFYQSFHGKTASGRLPAIFPVVLYNGDRHWTVAGNSADLIERTIPVKYIPSFTYYAIIENEIPKGTLLKIHNAPRHTEDLKNEMDALFAILKDVNPEIKGLFIKWLNDFLASTITMEKLDLENIKSPEEAKIMFATRLKEFEQKLVEQGREQGIEQGREQGERRKTLETAQKMKAEGLESALICRITGLSEKKLEVL